MNTPDDSARRPLKSRSSAWARALSGALVARRVSPNTVSLAGIGFACIGAAGMLFAPAPVGLLIGAAGVQLRLVCNLLDGLVAVEGGLKSKAGDLFNEAPDRIEDALLLISAGYACGHAELGWCCAVLAVATAYLRALGASLGLGQDYRGPCAKQHRMAILTVGLLAGVFKTSVLFIALWLIVVLTALTIARRVVRIYTKLP